MGGGRCHLPPLPFAGHRVKAFPLVMAGRSDRQSLSAGSPCAAGRSDGIATVWGPLTVTGLTHTGPTCMAFTGFNRSGAGGVSRCAGLRVARQAWTSYSVT
jgi:hypothetical protein